VNAQTILTGAPRRDSDPYALVRLGGNLTRKGTFMTRIAILVVATSLAAAAQGTKGPPPKPDPALVQAFGPSVGTWTCTGTMTMPKEMGGGEMKTRSKMVIKREVSGFAYSGDYQMPKTKAFPGMRGRMLWTYDPAAKKFYELAADTTGGTMRGESDGLKDGKMTWSEEGTMMGKPTKSTTTITGLGKKTIQIDFDSGDMKGTDRCKKS